MERDSTGCLQPVTGQGVRKNPKTAGTKCGTLCESPIETPEIQELFDIATGWSSLPQNIRVAIVLLVEQHVKSAVLVPEQQQTISCSMGTMVQ
jgi:hypothetical protein